MCGIADNRLELQQRLKLHAPNVYFQPPSDVAMVYPAIVYRKTSPDVVHANDSIYRVTEEYAITVIDPNPDSKIADNIMASFRYCSINDRFVIDRLHHTILKLYF